MSLNIGDNFKYLGKKFLDERQSFNTLEEMSACNDVPKGFITICYEDDTRYEFDGTEWVEYAGGGGGGSTEKGTLSTTLPDYSTINEGDKVNIPYTFTSPNYGEAKLYITIVNGEASRDLEYPILRQGGGNVSLGTLTRGVNHITMYAVDALAKMTNIVSITIVCGALDINSTFDDGQDYSIYSNISIPVNVNALNPNDTMTLHYNIDGNEATMQVYNGFNTFVFPADYKTVGVHTVTLQVIGTGFQSNILEYNIVVCDNTHILLSTKSLEVSIEEGYSVELEYRVSTTNVADYSVVYTLNSVEYLRSKAVVGKNKFTGSFKDFPLGDHTLGIVVSSSDGLLTASLNITIHVVPNSFKRIEHATIGLEAYFDMSRNNNNSPTKNELLSVVPTSTGSTAKLVLHDYNYATNGWIDGRLVSNGKAWAEMVDYLPLEDDAINGFTFDILFRSDNMGNNYANIIECTGVDSPYMGFAIDSEKAILTTEVNKLNTYYTDKEDMRITFIVNRTSTYYEEYIKDPETGWSIKNPNPTYKPNPMIQTFVNGIFTDVAMLSDTGSGNNKIYEHIQNTSQLLINTDKNKTAFGNSSIKSIRIYSRPLDHEEVLQNYMADIDDLMEQKAVYDKNYVTVDQDLPTLNFYDTEIGKCDLMTKDTKQWINVVYTSPNPKVFGNSFNLMGQASWQGTSSLAYPTKNYKFKLYDWARDENGDIIEASKWDKKTYTKKKINMYPSEPNGKKENTYCLKADYMDSSHCRNTGTARLVNDFLFDGHPNPAKQIDPQTRDTINGFPCNLYINGRWMGVFNFNHDKSCTKTLGMETIPNTVRWEIKANSDSSAGAFIKTWTNVDECYKAINTDFEIVYDEDAFEDKTGEYDVTKYYDELGFAHEGTVMGTYYDYAILSLARFVNFVSGADEATWKAHISEYCDVEQACRYYLNVMTMGMIDNFAKNCIINMYGDDIWWFSFYDMDSSLGLDNTGYNKFDSNIEPSQPGIYNCSTSRMWVKLNEYSQDDLFNTFKTIREGKYTYENICKYLIEKQIDVIPQLLYNKDMYQKYISQGRQYLHMLHGNNKDHLKRWLYNRFQYVDSLFLQHNSPYTKQSITIRSCAPANAVPKVDSEGNIISPYTARFEIQTYVPQYVTVCWRKNTFETKRVNWNETVVFENDMVNSQDNELIVYCANNLKHLGDISGLNPTSVDIGNATRLIEFVCEDSDKLVKADLSKNNFLKKASFKGCSVMGTASGGSNVLDVTGCTNLKELDIRGTQITSLLTNTEGGNLEKILYPEAIQNVVLSNQINLEVIGLPLDVEQDIYAKNLSSVTILNCENVKTLSYPYIEGEPVNFNSLKYVQNLTLSNSIPSLTELSFNGFSKLRNINVYTMPQITSIKFTDLIPATETSTFKTLTLANIPQVDTVSFNVTSNDYKIAFASGAKVDLGNLTSCHTIESNYSIKGLNTLILPITVRNLKFTTEYGDGVNDITNIWSHNCNHEGDGFTGLDFADMSIDYIDMIGLSKVTNGINFNLSPTEHNPNLNTGRDGSAEKPYFRPTGTLNLNNYTGSMVNMLKGVDLSKLEVILTANKTQTDLSYLFYGAIGTNTDVVDRMLGRFPNSKVWDYMFATSDRNTDYDLPLRLTSVIGTFKDTTISEYLKNWNKTYNKDITATDCYAGTSGDLDEIPTAWGGFGFTKDVTSIIVVKIPSDNYTMKVCQYPQYNLLSTKMINWGDGTVTTGTNTHTYATAGTYTIKGHIGFGQYDTTGEIKTCLIEVKQIATFGQKRLPKSFEIAFKNCNKLTKVTTYNLAPIGCYGMFAGCSSLTEIVGMDTWDMSKCTSVVDMFNSCSSLTEIIGMDTWDMSNCSNINGILQYTGITDATPVYNMLSTFTGSSADYLFRGTKIESIELGRFPSSIKSFSNIAVECTNLKTIDFTGINPNTTTLNRAFRMCQNVTSIIGANTINFNDGVDLSQMFYATLTNIEEIDLSGITCKIKGVPSFNNTGNKLKTIKMAWDWSNITGNLPSYMFADFNTLENVEWGRNLKANFTGYTALANHKKLTVQSLLNLFNA